MDATQVQNALQPAGAHAAEIAKLWWFYVGLTSGVVVLVLGSIAFAVALRRGQHADPAPHSLNPARERSARRNVILASAATVIALFVLLSESIFTNNRLAALDAGPAIDIEVTGKQWFWQVRYLDADPSRVFYTANEIHVPVNRNVRLQLTSADVIHSFWAPSLHGKRDLIPGRTNVLTVRATRPGRYRSQCAEFCGMAHAQMSLWVVVESQAAFDTWRAHQREPARSPQSPIAQQGQAVFMRSTCASCHTIAGTDAQANVGPDLSHLASRSDLAAGVLPNQREPLGRWLTHAPDLKPGVRMPHIALASNDRDALVAYLEALE